MTLDDDKARFEALFAAHRAAVLAYARRRVDADTAADVVAETFLVAWRRLDAVAEDPLPWLYGVARKVIANQRRAHRRSEALLGRLAVGGVPLVASPEQTSATLDALRVAFARLGECDREALRLVAWEDLDPEQAARAAGCSRATFAVRLHRARRRLAAAMAQEHAPVLPLEVSREA